METRNLVDETSLRAFLRMLFDHRLLTPEDHFIEPDRALEIVQKRTERVRAAAVLAWDLARQLVDARPDDHAP